MYYNEGIVLFSLWRNVESSLIFFCLSLVRLCVSFFSLHRDAVLKSAIASVVSLVSLYGDRRRGPTLFCWERGACTGRRRRSPFASIFGSEFNETRAEGRETVRETKDGWVRTTSQPENRSASGWLLRVGQNSRPLYSLNTTRAIGLYQPLSSY